MTDKNQDILKEYILLINKKISEYFVIDDSVKEQQEVIEAMIHSVSAGGKRIRPVLTLEFCKMCGGKADDALPAAVAIEMIHTFSLIHDDLPCMDNDDYRRGKPSCHKAFGESTALLAGDALENLAYNVIAESALNDKIKVKLISKLTSCVGVTGMIGGQIMDIKFEKCESSMDSLLKMYYYKTGALLTAACSMGCICAGANEQQILEAEEFAKNLGLAFQVQDDILDVTSSYEELGKLTGSDSKAGKNTYVSLAGVEQSQKDVEKFTEAAIHNLCQFNNNDFVLELTKMLATRKN